MRQNKKSSICMFGQKHLFSREGGVEVVATEICRRLVLKGYEVTAIDRGSRYTTGVRYDDKRIKKECIRDGIYIRTAPMLKKKGVDAVTSSFFASIMAAIGPYDIVHIHAEGPSAFCWIPKLFGKKVICHNHGIDHMRAKWTPMASRFIRFGEKMSVRYADELIVLNESIAGYFRDKYGREARIIRNGITMLERRSPDIIKEKYGLESGYILSVSRMCPEKNIHGLIEAYNGVKNDIKLVIAGYSSDSEKYMDKIRKITDGNPDIILTGFVDGRCLEELYSNCRIFVQPSELEGMSMSLLEAMSYGNCCLISDIPENIEVTGDKAVTFKSGNVDDLRDKLQILCDDSSLVDKYRKEAADHVLSRYNWDDTVDEVIKLYESMV